MEKCEKPWNITNGITKQTPYRLIEKKNALIHILREHNYKVVDDRCEKITKSRLISVENYRDK